MSPIQVRPFRRSDRDQLTQLVNAHAEAVVPGLSVSVNAVLASLERQPGEFIEDPSVAKQVTLVAEQQNQVAPPRTCCGTSRTTPARIAGTPASPLAALRAETPAGNPYSADSAPTASRWSPRAWPSSGPGASAASTRPGNCPSTASTGCPSSGLTSARSTRRPGSPTPGTPRSSTWPGWKTCRVRPAPRSRGCRARR